ncbi:hypothetical protein [Salegentibacter sp. Hel_I_6]|uniref:hypothetical protein n=1 Tax=Salegentibacter sp. Hel_I_6 TaxID=1250278 RepID=UPI000565E3D0|nr:hypothetical protein [Salegentibacter sp. Hel_I_6]
MNKIYSLLLLLLVLNISPILAQAEFTTWGNMTGIRVNNQLMEFNSSLVLMKSDWDNAWITRKEGQKIDFERNKDTKIFSYKMDSTQWVQSISDVGEGKAKLKIDFKSPDSLALIGAFFRIELPPVFGSETNFEFKNPESISGNDFSGNLGGLYNAPAKGLLVSSASRQLQIDFEKQTNVIIRKNEDGTFQLNFEIASGEIPSGKNFSNTFSIEATGDIDDSVVELKVFPEQEGKKFDGIGGNFRLQNPTTDPQVIDYSLENLRVAWSRVEMPWREWHPDAAKDPIEEAKNGNLDPKVEDAMKMAQRLDEKGIPVILAAWFAPRWAIIGEPSSGIDMDGNRGNLLDLERKEEIYASLTSYIKYLKDEYGVKTVMFSFNEADLGIDVRQTEEEHNEMIKELGVYFRENGLETDFLLGDTADANGWDFTTEASTDPESRPYIGGVSFHSWRGWTDENLTKWNDISNRVNKPLFIGEGSIDAGAWRYPQILEEPTYALDEIDVYLKILNKAQPLTILQWQLTADYSPMSGGGIFGNDEEELHPTQRFFNLQQLGNTPKGLFALPITTSNEAITPAALGDKDKGSYAIHLVNKGATREVSLTGLPEGISGLNVYLTNIESSNELIETISVENGTVNFELQGAGFTSLMTE